VVSARAKQRIKSSLNDERKVIAMDGKEILERKFKQFNVRMNSENISFLEKYFNVPSATELYFRIAKGKVDLAKLRELEVIGGMIQLIKKEVVKKKINPDN